MLEKLEKFEEKLNALLGRVLGGLLNLLLKLVPKGLQLKISKLSHQFKEKKELFKLNQKQRAVRSFEKVKTTQNYIFDNLTKLQNYPLREKIILFRLYLMEQLKTHPKVHFYNLKEYLKKFFLKLKTKLSNKNDIYTKISVLSVFLILLSASFIYLTGLDIYKREFQTRAPASVQEYDYRPDYQQYTKKTLKVLNVKIPVWAAGVEKISTITVDFSIRTSTRFARYYLLEYEYKLRDHFFSTMEPIESDFPLEDEGKDIIKDVLIDEVNHFLKSNNVEGQVEEINILYIVGS